MVDNCTVVGLRSVDMHVIDLLDGGYMLFFSCYGLFNIMHIIVHVNIVLLCTIFRYFVNAKQTLIILKR